MAWRVEEYVVRGEIDNTVRGRVTGRLWFRGRTAAVEIALAGNAAHDLAGRRLEFVNPEPKPGLDDAFAGRQDGAVGDITASRKVKVLDIPMSELAGHYRAGKPVPWHWGNSLYLEWYGTRNGRVVIESASFELRIVGEPAWEMSREEETAREQSRAEADRLFLEGADEGPTEMAVDEPAVEEWESRPMTEKEAEAMYERSEQLKDRIVERIEREDETADLGDIIREEIDRQHRERGEPGPTPEQQARQAEGREELARLPEDVGFEAADENVVELEHPLAVRAYDFTLRIMHKMEAAGWLRDAAFGDPALNLRTAIMKASARLAGALDGDDRPPEREFCAANIVRLKRALGFWQEAKDAAVACAEEDLVDPVWLATVRLELTALAEETDKLIGELRERLKQGFD